MGWARVFLVRPAVSRGLVGLHRYLGIVRRAEALRRGGKIGVVGVGVSVGVGDVGVCGEDIWVCDQSPGLCPWIARDCVGYVGVLSKGRSLNGQPRMGRTTFYKFHEVNGLYWVGLGCKRGLTGEPGDLHFHACVSSRRGSRL